MDDIKIHGDEWIQHKYHDIDEIQAAPPMRHIPKYSGGIKKQFFKSQQIRNTHFECVDCIHYYHFLENVILEFSSASIQLGRFIKLSHEGIYYACSSFGCCRCYVVDIGCW